MSDDLRTCVIMQPCFLPWAGYFNLIANADHFVFLTDAAFQKGSWHNRNQILIQGKKSWITCPIQRNELNSALDSIELQPDSRWRNKLTRTMIQSYTKASFFNDVEFILDIINDSVGLTLVELNIRLIRQICSELSLETQFSDSRELCIDSGRSEKLYEIIKNKNCGRYLSPMGSKDYIYEDNVLPNSPIELDFQNFVPVEYEQVNSPTFVSHLSIFDVIANLGIRGAGNYVLKG